MASAGLTLSQQTDESDARRLLGQRVAAVLCTVGSITAYIGAFTLHMTPGAKAVQIALAVGFTVVGAVLAVTRPRPIVTHVALFWCVFAISAMLATADTFGTTPFFYLWPAVFAAYFCTPRVLGGVLVFLAITLMGALVISPIGWAVKADTFIGVNLSVGVMAGLVAIMQQRETRLNRKLAEAAHTDPLTGLLNRRGFDPRFEEIVVENVEQGRPVSVVMFDLDHFKRFNDDHGHMVGDDALRRMATVLGNLCRDVDLVARLGGEEFAVVLPGATAADAKSYAERVAWGLGTEKVDASLRLTTSSGIGSVESGGNASCVSTLLLRADEALYAAKAGGRDRAAWWATGGGLEVGDRIDIPDPELDSATMVPARPREYVVRANDRRDPDRLRNRA